MKPQTLVVRVDSLEQRMDALDSLPDRMGRLESQFVLLRTEMHDAFSAVRRELGADLQAHGDQIRSELRADLQTHGDQVRSELRAEIREGDEETRRQMRLLHEDVIERLTIIQEGRLPRGRSATSGRPPRRSKR